MSNIINVARGFEKADLVIKNANIVNVLSEEIHKADIAIKDGIIAGIGENYSGEKRKLTYKVRTSLLLLLTVTFILKAQ